MGRLLNWALLLAGTSVLALPTPTNAGDEPPMQCVVRFTLISGGSFTETVHLEQGKQRHMATALWPLCDEVRYSFHSGIWSEPVPSGFWSITACASQEQAGDVLAARLPGSPARLADDVRLELQIENLCHDFLPTSGEALSSSGTRHVKTLSLGDTKSIVLARDELGKPISTLNVTLVSIGSNHPDAGKLPFDKGVPADTLPPSSRPLTHRPLDFESLLAALPFGLIHLP
jgi:hypothetical protein